MRVLLVAATSFEVAPTYEWLQLQCQQIGQDHFKKDFLEVQVLLTGVGMPLTAFALTKHLNTTKAYDLVINVGIAGALNRSMELGQVLQVHSESFADLGVEEADGSFTSMHELDLLPTDHYPFSKGKLVNPHADASFLPLVEAISVNKVHGYAPSIEALRANTNADIESMEGAAFFYVCLMEQLRFLEIRSISNYVEARNRENWNIPLAIQNLNQVLLEMLQALVG